MLGEIKCEWGTEKDMFEQVGKEISKQFWRSLGFRRIGSSDWFGLASDPEHPGWHLTAADDYELPALSSGPLDPDVGYLLKSPPNFNDDDYVSRLKQVFDNVAADDPRWQSADAHGNTILHIAAIESKPTSVQWILRRTNNLTQQRNSQGETPLDALLATLENKRTTHRTNFLTADVSDQFTGFSDTAVSCLAFLNVRIQVMDADWQRFKYGCTCGQCISGFLSPRMRFALECQAEIWADFLLEDIDRGNDWVRSNHACLTFLPHWVRNNLKTNQSMRKGFMNLCNHTAACLRENKIPTEQNVETVLCDASEWPPSSREFLRHGGNVSAVVTMLFQRAMESDEFAGDPLHLECHEDYIEKLPGCRNDHEFGFVSGMCGYERVSDVAYVPDRTGSL